jgi:hypothetical protein
MQLAFMDESFNIIRYIKFINLQWIRRYYEPGEFNVQIPASEYDADAAYLFTTDRPELGLIQKDSTRMAMTVRSYSYPGTFSSISSTIRSSSRALMLPGTSKRSPGAS